MLTPELLRAFVNVPELSAVGSGQERAAFVALHVEGRTIREAAEALGVSKSQVANLSNLFQSKMTAKMGELQRNHIGGSPEYKAAFSALLTRLYQLEDESGSNDWHWNGKVGHFRYSDGTREDKAECFGQPAPRFDDE